MQRLYSSLYDSPLGILKISANDEAVTEVLFSQGSVLKPGDNDNESPLVKECITQLDEYFNGERQRFDLRLYQPGTSFQQSVWKELLNIPFGSTISYLELSRRIGNV